MGICQRKNTFPDVTYMHTANEVVPALAKVIYTPQEPVYLSNRLPRPNSQVYTPWLQSGKRPRHCEA